MKFTFQRDRTLISTCGLSVSYKAGVPQLTPPPMYAEALAAGGIPDEELAAEPGVKSADDRKAMVFAAFDDIVKRNDPKDFTAGGLPHSGVVADKVGFSITAKERDTLWAAYSSEGQGGSDRSN